LRIKTDFLYNVKEKILFQVDIFYNNSIKLNSSRGVLKKVEQCGDQNQKATHPTGNCGAPL